MPIELGVDVGDNSQSTIMNQLKTVTGTIVSCETKVSNIFRQLFSIQLLEFLLK